MGLDFGCELSFLRLEHLLHVVHSLGFSVDGVYVDIGERMHVIGRASFVLEELQFLLETLQIVLVLSEHSLLDETFESLAIDVDLSIVDCLDEVSWVLWHHHLRDGFLSLEMQPLELFGISGQEFVQVVLELLLETQSDDRHSISVSSGLQADIWELLFQLCDVLVEALSKTLIEVVLSFSNFAGVSELHELIIGLEVVSLLDGELRLNGEFFLDLIKFVLQKLSALYFGPFSDLNHPSPVALEHLLADFDLVLSGIFL